MPIRRYIHYNARSSSSSPPWRRRDGDGFEDKQFEKMTEASRYEVMKAMAEIERTKNCIRMAEMRLNTAKKMEEAAKAVEPIAVATKSVNMHPSPSSYKDNMRWTAVSLSTLRSPEPPPMYSAVAAGYHSRCYIDQS